MSKISERIKELMQEREEELVKKAEAVFSGVLSEHDNFGEISFTDDCIKRLAEVETEEDVRIVLNKMKSMVDLHEIVSIGTSTHVKHVIKEK